MEQFNLYGIGKHKGHNMASMKIDKVPEYGNFLDGNGNRKFPRTWSSLVPVTLAEFWKFCPQKVTDNEKLPFGTRRARG